MTLEEARKACDEGLLCLYHLPRNGPYVPAEEIHVYITTVSEDFNHDFWGTPESKKPRENNYGVEFVRACKIPYDRPTWISGLKHIKDALSFAQKPDES